MPVQGILYLTDSSGKGALEAADMLRRRGYLLVCWADILSHDVLAEWKQVSGVVVRQGWEQSEKAPLEVAIARALDKPVLRFPDLEPEPERPIERARRLVYGDRGHVYGHPAEDFARTAGMWRALFGWEVEAKDVPLAMICVKLSRLRQTPDHEDSPVDIEGYAEAYWMVIERLGRKVEHPPKR